MVLAISGMLIVEDTFIHSMDYNIHQMAVFFQGAHNACLFKFDLQMTTLYKKKGGKDLPSIWWTC